MKKMGYKIIFCLLILIVVALLIQNIFLVGSFKSRIAKADFGMIDHRISNLFLEVQRFPYGAGDDILFLSKMSSLENFINERTLENRRVVRKDFQNLEEVKDIYYDIMYVDSESEISLRENKVKYEDLDREFASLGYGEIYASSLFFLENNSRNQFLRYLVPIVNKDRRGYLLLDIKAANLLEDVRRYKRNNEEVFLINFDGSYLSHENKSKVFGGENKGDSFFEDYPEASKQILNSSSKGIVESEDSIFLFRYIYPTMKEFEVYKGSEKIWGEHSEEKNYWVLIDKINKEQVKVQFKV